MAKTNNRSTKQFALAGLAIEVVIDREIRGSAPAAEEALRRELQRSGAKARFVRGRGARSKPGYQMGILLSATSSDPVGRAWVFCGTRTVEATYLTAASLPFHMDKHRAAFEDLAQRVVSGLFIESHRGFPMLHINSVPVHSSPVRERTKPKMKGGGV